jgi:glyceraldehyde-3-phosphate dehydrogenase/erythrose-4-phosphate dehydrogenase
LASDITKNIKKIFPLNCFGVADRIAKQYEKQLYKIKSITKYGVWNGKIFDIVPAASLKRLVRQVIENLPDEDGDSDIVVTTDGEFVTKDDLIKFKKKMSTPSALSQVIQSLETCGNIEKEESEFDQTVDQIVTQNGILNLRTGILRDLELCLIHDRYF